jgi:hypothetical protein
MADPRGFIAPVIIRGNVWLTFSRGVVRMINLHFSKLVLCLPADLNGYSAISGTWKCQKSTFWNNRCSKKKPSILRLPRLLRPRSLWWSHIVSVFCLFRWNVDVPIWSTVNPTANSTGAKISVLTRSTITQRANRRFAMLTCCAQ